jgi:chromosome segregation ATPase
MRVLRGPKTALDCIKKEKKHLEREREEALRKIQIHREAVEALETAVKETSFLINDYEEIIRQLEKD